MKPALVSGIQPTGKLHIGNYLGALANFVELQNSGKHSCFFFVADLHSLTIPFDPKEKRKEIEGIVRDYLAAGLNPKKSVLFAQSDVPAHTELAWVLNTITPMGELRRMTQFKDKESFNQNAFEEIKKILGDKKMSIEIAEKIYNENKELSSWARETSANLGLFAYPVLMAADILLYSAGSVPVGNDQDQHLELARTLARKFNGKFGNTFVEPKALHTVVPRVMSLDDPTKKMSKSSPAGCIFLDDSPEVITQKIKRAVTDSERGIAYDPEHRPGISNLLELFSAVTGQLVEKIVKSFEGKGYAEFKPALANAIIERLAGFQVKKKKVKDSDIKKVLVSGAKKANAVAVKKLAEVKKKVGLVR